MEEYKSQEYYPYEGGIDFIGEEIYESKIKPRKDSENKTLEKVIE